MDEVPDTRPSLLVRLRDPRDDRAWTEFTAIYSPLIYRLACRKGFQDADAEDLVQEVLRGRFRHGPLGTRAMQRAVSQLAVPDRAEHDAELHRQPAPTSAGDGLGGNSAAPRDRPSPSPEDSALFETEYKRQLFRWAAEQVSGEFRGTTWAAFWETGVEGKKAQVVADTLGMSVGAVYMAKSRVVARIRQVIEQVEGEWPGLEQE